MKLIAGSIRQFVANRQNAGAALDMLCGSSLAALSFGTTGLGNVHRMAMAVGAVFPVPHGLANPVCLTHAASFNFIANPARYASVCQILGGSTADVGDLEAGRRTIGLLRDLCVDVGAPIRLRDVGVTEESLPDLARRSFATDYNRWNPHYTSEKDFGALFRDAY